MGVNCHSAGCTTFVASVMLRTLFILFLFAPVLLQAQAAGKHEPFLHLLAEHPGQVAVVIYKNGTPLVQHRKDVPIAAQGLN